MSSIERSEVSDQSKDRLSELPDSLLFHILSPLGTKQVIKTCVLSKRWQFLWTDSSELLLCENSSKTAKIRSFMDSVGRILLMCTATHLNKLHISFWYQKSFTSNMNLWVQFAVKNKVKHFSLECVANKDWYVLPQMFYSNPSFTSLNLNCCPIAPRGAIDWKFLKSLSIHYVELTELVLQKILSGCPVLEILKLSMFWGLTHLEVLSRNLSQLLVVGWKNSNKCDLLDISAPYVRVLSVSYSKVTKFINSGGISSLVVAKLDYRFAENATTFSQVDLKILPGVKLSIESFRFVKALELCPWCIEVLSRLEEKGLHFSLSTRLNLTLNAWRHKRSVAGILNILKSSPDLETLVITGTSFEPHMIPNTHNQAAAYLRADSTYLVLGNLKTVKISGFSGEDLVDEPMLTLVQLLLKSATILEKMDIEISTVSKLLSLRGSSPKAAVVIH